MEERRTITQVKEELASERESKEQAEQDPVIIKYNQTLANINRLNLELEQLKADNFFEMVKACDHIFFTGLDRKGHIKTICLECGLTSDADDFIKLKEPNLGYMRELIITLFVYGEAYSYYFVTGFFEDIDEAKEYYDRVKEANALLNPKEIVPKMLQLKGISVNYIN